MNEVQHLNETTKNHFCEAKFFGEVLRRDTFKVESRRNSKIGIDFHFHFRRFFRFSRSFEDRPRGLFWRFIALEAVNAVRQRGVLRRDAAREVG